MKPGPKKINKTDLLGYKLGYLEVVELTSDPKNLAKNTTYRCKCFCGKEILVGRNKILGKKHPKGCGCLPFKEDSDKVVGKKFGKLKIESFSHRDKYRRKVYNAKCDCGNSHTVASSVVLSGGSKSCGCLAKQLSKNRLETRRGSLNPNYNSDLTEQDRVKKRSSFEYTQWAKDVKERDQYSCNICSQIGYDLVSHHLNAYATFPSQRTLLNNGVCLCKNCHLEFHNLYGRGKNTESEFIEFQYYKSTNNE